jgi:hypothetical protein
MAAADQIISIRLVGLAAAVVAAWWCHSAGFGMLALIAAAVIGYVFATKAIAAFIHYRSQIVQPQSDTIAAVGQPAAEEGRSQFRWMRKYKDAGERWSEKERQDEAQLYREAPTKAFLSSFWTNIVRGVREQCDELERRYSGNLARTCQLTLDGTGLRLSGNGNLLIARPHALDISIEAPPGYFYTLRAESLRRMTPQRVAEDLVQEVLAPGHLQSLPGYSHPLPRNFGPG